MNMNKKALHFNGTLLPISTKKLTCWAPSDSASLEEQLKKGAYILCKPKVWGAKRLSVTDFIADSTGQVFFTIDKFEVALILGPSWSPSPTAP